MERGRCKAGTRRGRKEEIKKKKRRSEQGRVRSRQPWPRERENRKRSGGKSAKREVADGLTRLAAETEWCLARLGEIGPGERLQQNAQVADTRILSREWKEAG